jgi:glycerate 2-kinase
VDGSTWANVAATGRDPEMDLVLHDSYPALDSAGALLKVGLTGTNVMDLVAGIVIAPR